MKNLLDVERLVLGYATGIVIRGVSISVLSGSLVGLVGRNGSGRSTLVMGLAGLLRPQQGRIKLHGEDITDRNTRERIQRGLVCLPQMENCFLDLTVNENLRVAVACLGLTATEIGAREDRVFTTLAALARLRNQRVRNLSGGQRRMVDLGMIFMQEPKCLILDEPFAGLAEPVVDAMAEALVRFTKDGQGILLVEEKPNLVFKLADHILYLEDGIVERVGTPTELKDDTEFLDRYLGLNSKTGNSQVTN
jgi:branched-chain amino acid transport system ATP-binding protein